MGIANSLDLCETPPMTSLRGHSSASILPSPRAGISYNNQWRLLHFQSIFLLTGFSNYIIQVFMAVMSCIRAGNVSLPCRSNSLLIQQCLLLNHADLMRLRSSERAWPDCLAYFSATFLVLAHGCSIRHCYQVLH